MTPFAPHASSTTRTGGRGFTLIELLVTISLLVIIMAIAAPSFMGYLRNAELSGISNSFLAALNAARTEAMKRNMFALVTPKNNDNDWAKGWVVFVDTDNDMTFDSTKDILVMQQEAPPPYITLSGNNSTAANPSYVRYDGSGFSRPASGDLPNTTLTIARSDASTDYRQIRRIKIAVTGRAKICTPKASDDANCLSTD
ncbi:MAG: GspH/FimT family pseudopilin [Comamonas sp.]|uniref:GspH/FimT family pseudopilin n=1 Tax=Comamonas sp. TaxID=34028 RepID=UPI002FC8F5AF